jgi:hypothetical protein
MIDKIPIIHTEDLEKPEKNQHLDVKGSQSGMKDNEQETPAPKAEVSEKESEKIEEVTTKIGFKKFLIPALILIIIAIIVLVIL